MGGIYNCNTVIYDIPCIRAGCGGGAPEGLRVNVCFNGCEKNSPTAATTFHNIYVFAPRPDIKSLQRLNLKSNFISKSALTNLIQNNTIWTVDSQFCISTKGLLPCYGCWCWCCLNKHVYFYLDWQYKIVGHAHCRFRQTNVLQVCSNWWMKSSLTGYNIVMKMNQLIKRMIEEWNWIANETKTSRIWIEYMYEWHHQQHHLISFFPFTGQRIKSV